MTTRSCGACTFSGMTVRPNGQFDPNSRTCKKDPPQVVLIPVPQGLQVKSLWPEVGPQDWCHGFERRPNISDLEIIDVGSAKN
jgi:hypothetical protein